MTAWWDVVVVAAVLALASVVAARHLWAGLVRPGASGCASACGGCTARPVSEALVQLRGRGRQ